MAGKTKIPKKGRKIWAPHKFENACKLFLIQVCPDPPLQKKQKKMVATHVEKGEKMLLYSGLS